MVMEDTAAKVEAGALVQEVVASLHLSLQQRRPRQLQVYRRALTFLLLHPHLAQSRALLAQQLQHQWLLFHRQAPRLLPVLFQAHNQHRLRLLPLQRCLRATRQEVTMVMEDTAAKVEAGALVQEAASLHRSLQQRRPRQLQVYRV